MVISKYHQPKKMIHTIPFFRFCPSHLHLHLHLQASTFTTAASPSGNHAALTNPTFHSYGRAAASGGLPNGNWWVLRSNNPTAVASSALELESASNVVRKFYDGINRRDLASVEDLISLNCIYEDLVFPRPFIGRKAILEFFKQFMDSISADLQFAIDDISEEDLCAVGVTWHLDMEETVWNLPSSLESRLWYVLPG
ncbi:UNVERIFIED_CONTAM: hypothetical protein Sradi_3682800 [Sesamum radiatum]|uniref:SnoaL-like domain-containing protein n=1 Tax=Sesamum radiatum TaxID=300843 RepID=A0AAW2PWV8_SESRA